MKQIEFTKKKINGNMYYIQPFPAFTAANISGELLRVLAPALGGIASILMTDSAMDSEGKVDIKNLEIEEALPAFSTAMSKLSGDEFEYLMKKLLINHKNIRIVGEITEGEPEILDMDKANEVFCGDLQDMVLLAYEVIKVNYGDFFGKIAGRFGSLPESTKEPDLKNMEP